MHDTAEFAATCKAETLISSSHEAIADVRLFAWGLESRVGVCCGLVKDMSRGGVISFDIDDEGYIKI
ncbi:uncharacterized protein EAE97_005760 [Botrytis byssoidea]|uniref:Uncharacterized protein n=1 Tax=Botrytis byssoidea TaxID=139641 RepID=A0A9P5LZD1_9HELO|nr:uncharacterized protein EAE97_005760 [Botrytis byssoidea]KAF7943689.1 hypothetical protein EAE97_005760 [Botrytis byssoidea]